jgi:type I restriction enzyme S subunit
MLQEGWILTKLSRLIKIKHGFAFKGELITDVPNGKILLTPGNFRIGGGFKDDKLRYYLGEYPAEYALEEGDLLISMTDLSKLGDTLGFPLLVPKTEKGVFLHNQRLGKVTIRENAPVLKEYLFYVLCSQDYRNEVLSSATGTTVKHTSPSRIMDYEFSLPPVEEQRKIANMLRNFDAKIQLNDQIRETIESIGNAVFKQWFIDFEFPNEFGGPYKSSGGELVSSEAGEIPKSWRLSTLDEVLEIHDSKRIPLSNRERAKMQGQYRYYGATSVIDYVNKYLFDGIYVLLGEDGSVINEDGTPVVQYVWGKFWVNNHAHVVTAKGGLSTEHLFLLLKQVNISPYVSGAVQPKLNQNNLRAIPVVLPPHNVCASFNETIHPLFQMYQASAEQSDILSQLRDALLPRLINGKIRTYSTKRRNAYGAEETKRKSQVQTQTNLGKWLKDIKKLHNN